jgi:hypothetical protein
MCKALNKIFDDELNLMIKNPDKPALSVGNTLQGGNWWVEVKGFNWKVALMLRIKELYPEFVDLVEEEWDACF